jgi:hypothetical protein
MAAEKHATDLSPQAPLHFTKLLIPQAVLVLILLSLNTIVRAQTLAVNKETSVTVTQSGTYRLRDGGHQHDWIAGTLSPTLFGGNYNYQYWTQEYDLSQIPTGGTLTKVTLTISRTDSVPKPSWGIVDWTFPFTGQITANVKDVTPEYAGWLVYMDSGGSRYWFPVPEPRENTITIDLLGRGFGPQLLASKRFSITGVIQYYLGRIYLDEGNPERTDWSVWGSASATIRGSLSVEYNAPPTPPSSSVRTFWHAGNFRQLNAESGKLLEDVGNLSHPANGEYGRVSSDRRDRFNTLLNALFTAIDNSLIDGDTGDWCDVKVKAASAGYEVVRYYDIDSGRWFVHGRDKTRFGQTYFYLNPYAKRNIVIEVPHEPYELGIAVQGAKIFKELAARALIINKEDRCSDPDEAIRCDHGSTSACEDGRIRESDVAHNTDNTFHLLHVRFSDMDAGTKFVQLHGFRAQAGRQNAVVGDSSITDVRDNSISNIFTNHLRGKISFPSTVSSCQESAGNPNPAFCGEANAQGRYTNNGDACAFTGTASGRFLHIEQVPSLRDDDESGDGMSWMDIAQALKLTWPNSYMNNGATDGTLGPRQTQYEMLSCETLLGTMNATVTFCGYPAK